MILSRIQIDSLFKELELPSNPHAADDVAFHLFNEAKKLWRRTSLIKSIHERQKAEQGKNKKDPCG